MRRSNKRRRKRKIATTNGCGHGFSLVCLSLKFILPFSLPLFHFTPISFPTSYSFLSHMTLSHLTSPFPSSLFVFHVTSLSYYDGFVILSPGFILQDLSSLFLFPIFSFCIFSPWHFTPANSLPGMTLQFVFSQYFISRIFFLNLSYTILSPPTFSTDTICFGDFSFNFSSRLRINPSSTRNYNFCKLILWYSPHFPHTSTCPQLRS